MIANHEINVYGMMCQHCETAVAKALGRLPGVANITASSQEKAVRLTLDDAQSKLSDIRATIVDEGYFLEPQGEETVATDAGPDSPPPAHASAGPDEAVDRDEDALQQVAFHIQGMTCANCSLAI